MVLYPSAFRRFMVEFRNPGPGAYWRRRYFRSLASAQAAARHHPGATLWYAFGSGWSLL